MDFTDDGDFVLTDDGSAALGRAWGDDAPWRVLTGLADIDSRLGGSDGESRAASLVADALTDAGVADVSQQRFPTQVWSRGECSLEVLGETTRETTRSFPALALPYSPAGDVTAPVVDVGNGTPRELREADVEGRVAVASTTTPDRSRFVHRMEKYGTAVEEGAEAFVFANHLEGQLPPTGALRYDEEAPVPGVGVSFETGERLRDLSDADRRVRVAVDAETAPGTSQNVVGHLGPDTDRELLLVAHYDAHDVGEGALDNGCGVACVVGAARLLSSLDLGCRVRVAAVGCEETGLVGSEQLASTTDIDSVAGVVNVDGAGRFRDLVAMTHGSDATEAVVERVAGATGQPIEVKRRPHPFSDQWPFVRRGVPALQLHADSGERGRGWTHTAADTRDKVDRRNLREHGMLAALLVVALTNAGGLPRLDIDRLQRAFERGEFETGMRAAGIWPESWE